MATWISLTPLCVWSDTMDFLHFLQRLCITVWCILQTILQFVKFTWEWSGVRIDVHEILNFFQNTEYQCSHKNLNSASCVLVILSSWNLSDYKRNMCSLVHYKKKVKRKWTSVCNDQEHPRVMFFRIRWASCVGLCENIAPGWRVTGWEMMALSQSSGDPFSMKKVGALLAARWFGYWIHNESFAYHSLEHN